MQVYRKKRSKIPFLLLMIFIIGILVLSRLDTILKLPYPLKYDELVFKYSRENQIDPYLVFSIIKAESDFNPDATSRRDAKGLMQITDKTGSWGAEKLGIEDFASDDLYLPEVNIRIGCWYVRQLMKEFDNNINLVIAAYNAGSGNVSEWLKDNDLSKDGKELVKIPFKETDNYLKKVNKYYTIYLKLYSSEKG